MKFFIINLALILGLSFLAGGCYTIVWSPSEEFPDKESYSGSNEFYGTDYYGSYGDYYESPWWIITPVPVYIITPEGVVEKNTTKERNSGRSTDTQNIRNSGERGFNDRDNGISTNNPTNTRSSDNSNVNKTPPPTRDTSYERTNSSNNSGSSGSSSNSSRSSDNGSRNNSGSRNSGNSRR